MLVCCFFSSLSLFFSRCLLLSTSVQRSSSKLLCMAAAGLLVHDLWACWLCCVSNQTDQKRKNLYKNRPRLLSCFHADFGKQLPSPTFWRVHPETARLQALCCALVFLCRWPCPCECERERAVGPKVLSILPQFSGSTRCCPCQGSGTENGCWRIGPTFGNAPGFSPPRPPRPSGVFLNGDATWRIFCVPM